MLARWQAEHPHVVVQVLVDPQLEPFGCVVESELGRIELGLTKQLATMREEVSAPDTIQVVLAAAAGAEQRSVAATHSAPAS
jgi:flagellar biosynthesis/type III secretory pathway protein FliH